MTEACGLVRHDRVAEASDRPRVEAALAVFGPRTASSSADARATLGQSGHHELPLADSGVAVIGRMRIDNRNELCDVLGISGNERHTVSDAALVLRAYRRWDDAFPEHVDGHLSVGVWDGPRRRLVLATGRTMEDSLVYYRDDHIVAFATALRILLELPGVPWRLREEYDTFPSGVPLFSGVECLPPATVATVDQDAFRSRRYWELSPQPGLRFRTDGEWIDAIRDAIDSAVRARLRGSRPVGALLSGGLDSSSLVCLAAEALRETAHRLVTFSSALPENHDGPETDEREFIEIVARHADVEVVYVWPPTGGLYDLAWETIQRDASPNVGPRHYLYSAFAEQAGSRGIGALLDGLWGEFGPSFDGHGFLADRLRHGRVLSLAREARQLRRVRGLGAKGLVVDMLEPLLPAPFRLYRRLRGRQQAEWATVDAFRTSGPVVRGEPGFPGQHLDLQSTQMEQARWATTRPYGGQRFAVDYLYPYGDNRALELCVAAPAHLKVHNGYGRYLIRAAMERVLPPDIQWRTSKKPFSPDYYRRLERSSGEALQWLRRIRDDFDAVQFVEQYVDLDRIEQTIHRLNRDGWDPVSNTHDEPKFVVQDGLHHAMFLTWFRQESRNRASAPAH